MIRKLPRPENRAALTTPQMVIYDAGWKPQSRFRVAVCGRHFGKTFEACEELRRAVRLAIANGVNPENEIWHGAPSLKQAKRVFWPRLKRAIPERWWAARPSETELTIKVGPFGHVIRIVGLDHYDSLRGSGLYFFLGDEWADVKAEAWTEVIRPMLSTSGGHALFIGTPKGYNHFHDLFLLGQPGSGRQDGWWSCLYTTRDGGQVPEEELLGAVGILDARISSGI